MKFDIILANPPFNLGVKMLTKWFDIANEICTVQPSTWLLGKKQKKDIVKNVDAWEKTEIESIQGSEHFDAAIGGVMAIQHFIKGKGKTQQNGDYGKQITFDGKKYNECNQITKFSNDDLLMEFFNKVRPDKLSDNLHMHILREPGTKGFPSCPIENKPNLNQYIYALNSLRGHKGTNDFYTIISNQEKEIKKRAGLYKDIKNIIINVDDKKGHYYTKSILEYYIPFNSIEELRNFLNYICTDFVRICLYLIKTNMHLDAGELKYIPWFDFSDPIFSKSPLEIDNYLYKKYNISNNIRKYIEKILPDYYGIRKGREYAEYCRKKIENK